MHGKRVFTNLNKVIRLVTKRGFACSQDYRIQGHFLKFLKSFIQSGSTAHNSYYYMECSKKREVYNLVA